MPGSFGYGMDVPAFTEQAQLGYQGYFVYQTESFTGGYGVKVARVSAGTEMPHGVIVRGGEYAGSGDPQSVVIRKTGTIKVKVGSGGITYNTYVKAGAGGVAVAASSDGDIIAGRALETATEGNYALVELAEVPFVLRHA